MHRRFQRLAAVAVLALSACATTAGHEFVSDRISVVARGSGPDVILIPEQPISIDEACDDIRRRHERGKDFSIVVVSEGYELEGLADAGEQDEFGHIRLSQRGVGDALGRYGFPQGHPFGPDRQNAFWAETQAQGLDRRVQLRDPVLARRAELERFCEPEFVEFVAERSERGVGFFDYGDTPVFRGAFEAISHVAGSALDGLRQIMDGKVRRAFQPIGGLHHARRDAAAGFCVFNDTGIVIETLRAEFGIRKVAYIDIDVHHGDGTQAIFDADPDLCFASTHQSPLYPGTGAASERGTGPGLGTKHNLPLPPGSGDAEFTAAWQTELLPAVEAFGPEAILVSAGYDAHRSDPLAELEVTEAGYRSVAEAIGRLSRARGLGGVALTLEGGYDLDALRQSTASTVAGLLAGLSGPDAG